MDLRDNRGKVHDLAFILLDLIIGLLRHRDGNLSSMYRYMVNNHSKFCRALGVDVERAISRAQLPRVLKKVNTGAFEQLLFSWFKIELNMEEKQWFAGDGKELRGSIEKGAERGGVLVHLVRHEDRAVPAKTYCNGTKDSEEPCLQQLVRQAGAGSQKITAGALHLCPAVTEPIEGAGGIFLIGLKGNQKGLLQDMKGHVGCFAPLNQEVTVEKGHGRLEKRNYFHYGVSEDYFEPRWGKTGFRSLFMVERSRIDLTTKEQGRKISFYISNGKANGEHGYFGAIRKHWSVEVNHHIRDKGLKEDQLRTKKNEVTTVMAGLRTLVMELFRQWKPKNIAAQMELFQDNFNELIFALKRINFL